MFENVGGKLKILAYISCILGIVGSICYGAVLLGANVLFGLLVMVVGSLLSWVASLPVYALGICTERAEEYPGGGRPADNIPADVMQFLNKQKEQDKKAEEEKKQAEKKKMEEEWNQKIQEAGGDNWIAEFLEKTKDCTRARELLEIWESIPKTECEATKEIDAMIKETAQVERMYGVNPKTIEKICNRVRELV